LFVMLMAMASAYTSASALPHQQSDNFDLTDTADEITSQAFDTQDAQTEIAYELTGTAAFSTPNTTNTPTSTGTPAPNASAQGTSVTGTLTQTPTPTTTITSVSATASQPVNARSQPTPPTVEPVSELPTETPIVVPADALTCLPGAPITITGTGPPHTPYLLYFGQRVVSGGSVLSNGHFYVSLIVGNERAGIYVVQVRVRGSSHVLRQLTCSVPDVTPTPLPRTSAQP
jgi:hypothetical protein